MEQYCESCGAELNGEEVCRECGVRAVESTYTPGLSASIVRLVVSGVFLVPAAIFFLGVVASFGEQSLAVGLLYAVLFAGSWWIGQFFYPFDGSLLGLGVTGLSALVALGMLGNAAHSAYTGATGQAIVSGLILVIFAIVALRG